MNSDSTAFTISSIEGFVDSAFKAGKSRLAFFLSMNLSLISMTKSAPPRIVEPTTSLKGLLYFLPNRASIKEKGQVYTLD